MARGSIDLDQLQGEVLSGTSNATKIVTTTSGTRTAGNLGAFDASGNLIDAGVTATSAGGGSDPFTVNGAATVKVNGVAVSFDDTVTVNGA